ncbi:tetratricopeptide repeat protein [Pandoraea oxalativorans]|uniref:tetratricopeptide repeat protein n=1 Tax=Pandoraea oxalativorans TaxID=573737 RepID=UPI0014720A24|nr:tetratricopeptide repeat protein [Pandoraea oxalativorans]
MSAECLQAISDLQDDREFNFDDPKAVERAYQSIVQMGVTSRIWDSAFHGGGLTKFMNVFGTLVLRSLAEKKNQTTLWIPGIQEDAVKSLVGLLSETAKNALLSTVEQNLEDTGFSKYFTAQDRWCLAGHLYYEKSVAEGLLAGRELQTAEAYACAARAYQQAGCHSLAAKAFRMAAATYALAGDDARAADAYAFAADAYVKAAEAYAKTNDYKQAAEAYEMAAQIYARIGEDALAASVYERAGQAYRWAELPGAAAGAYETAAGIYLHNGDYGSAAKAYEAAAETYMGAGKCDKAAKAYETLADTFMRAGQYKEAAKAYMTAARAYRRTGRHTEAAKAYMAAARAYRQTDQYDAAVDACRMAAEIYTERGRYQLAAQAHELAAQIFLATAKAYTEEGRLAPAIRAYELAEEANKRAAPAYESAAQAEINDASLRGQLLEQAEAANVRVGWIRAMIAFEKQAPQAEMIADINALIDQCLPNLPDGDRFSVGAYTFRMDDGEDFVSSDKFHPRTRDEWCAMNREDGMYDIILASTAAALIPTKRPHLRSAFVEGDVLRGQAFLDLLRAALLKLPRTAKNAPGSDDHHRSQMNDQRPTNSSSVVSGSPETGST